MEKHFEVGQLSELAAYSIGMAYVVNAKSNNRWNVIIFLVVAAVLTWIIYKSMTNKETKPKRNDKHVN
ncbi:hypothetical protein JAO76_15605 [Pontibacter sp. BT310]|uniref:Uncharacterized protein n=1 Tax=Pontibacter populi TaxID=890055 RepID=A0ABS6XFR9_9BACT|nr:MULTISPECIES: FeoB-associated Cys-rich membrane protein [Pontibacter]MBJ6119636.1 hypothetical protein [Pontibacter sp. BT310]MBR0572063.1 hypothetical protein [Microvirga sp. STS03]MBW3366489.1 hypothetical protein [Pontibacter populi]